MSKVVLGRNWTRKGPRLPASVVAKQKRAVARKAARWVGSGKAPKAAPGKGRP